MHREKYSFLGIKPKEEDNELQNQFVFPFRKSNINNMSEKSESLVEYLTKKAIDLCMQEMEGMEVENDFDWKFYFVHEIQTIKNEIQFIKNFLLTNRRF